MAARRHTLTALSTGSRYAMFSETLDRWLAYFEREHLLGTYIVCMSEHGPQDKDGPLSMWRGYGGNGKGAAIIFDTSRITPVLGTPLLVGKVRYGSQLERITWCDRLAEIVARVIASTEIPDDKLQFASAASFERAQTVRVVHKAPWIQRRAGVAYRVPEQPRCGQEADFQLALSERTSRHRAKTAF
jgi:hypothetical protein